MRTIKNRALRGISKLISLAAKHCTNLVTGLKDTVHLLNGKPLLLILGNPTGLAEIVAAEYPSLNGKCQFDTPDVILNLVAGDETAIVREERSDHATIVKIQTTDLKPRDGEVILADIALLDALEAVYPYLDVLLIAKSNNDFTAHELVQLALLNGKLADHAGVIYVGPAVNCEPLTETFEHRSIAHLNDAKSGVREQLTKCFSRVLHTNLLAALALGKAFSEKIALRIDEKYAAAERAAERDLDGTYDEKVLAADGLLSGLRQRGSELKSEIDSLYKDGAAEVQREFSAGKKDGVYQKAVSIINALKKPQAFNDDLDERLNETIYVESAGVVKRQTRLSAKEATEAYNRHAAGALSDLEAEGFSAIAPVSEPLEVSAMAKKMEHRDISDYLLVAVVRDDAKVPAAAKFYRTWLLIGAGSATGGAAGGYFWREDIGELAVAMPDFGAADGYFWREDIGELAVAMPDFGAAETLVLCVDGVSDGALLAAVAEGAAVAKVGATGAAGLGSLGLGVTAMVATGGTGAAGLSSLGLGGVTAIVATGGLALPIVLCGVGGGALGGWLAHTINKSSQVEAYKKAYRTAIGSSLHVISGVTAEVYSKTKEEQTTAQFDRLYTAIESAVSAELEIYKEASESPYLLESLPTEKVLTLAVAAELKELQSETATHAESEDLFDLLTQETEK